MKLLTRKTDYAVRALLFLAKSPNDFFSVREISGEEKIPYSFVRQILSALKKEAYVDSREGGSGGFRININPYKIKVADIIVLFQGRISLSDCMFRKKLCHKRSECVLRANIERIRSYVEKEFSRMSIGSLLKQLEQNKGGIK